VDKSVDKTSFSRYRREITHAQPILINF